MSAADFTTAPRPYAGFTLIELMIVVAVIGILAAIAIPSYNYAVMKSRRANAQACLAEHAQYMERYYTLNMRYDRDLAGTAHALPDLACAVDQAAYFSFDLSATTPVTASTFLMVATPTSAQVDSACGTMSLSNTGVKAPASGCWP